MIESFMSMVQGGVEWVLYLLIATSVVSVVLFVERAWVYRKATASVASLRKAIIKVLHGDGDRETIARKFAESGTVAGRTAAVALSEMSRSPEAAREMVEAHLLEEKKHLDRGLNFLATVGSNAPFVGLFGTVLGIVKAFHDLAHAKISGPQVVMAGISEALVATAVGLMVAIPAVIAYNAFRGKTKRLLSDAEMLVRIIFSHHIDDFLIEHGMAADQNSAPANAENPNDVVAARTPQLVLHEKPRDKRHAVPSA